LSTSLIFASLLAATGLLPAPRSRSAYPADRADLFPSADRLAGTLAGILDPSVNFSWDLK
jgi:hypothetical protein